MSERFNPRRTLDLGHLEQRVTKQDAERVQAARPERYEDGFRPAHPEGYRQIDVQKLKGDPAMAFFLLKNRDPWSC